MTGAGVRRAAQRSELRVRKSMSLHPQTIRIRHRLAEWTKQGRKHWDLYRFLLDPFLLHDALRLVLRNRGSSGVDGETWESIKGREWDFAARLAKDLRDRTYKPRPVRRVYIPKRDGRMRPLGIPSIRDRVVQRALVLLLEPIYEQVFLPCSYGFRRGRSAPACAADAAEGMFRRRYVLEADIESFFDRVVHRKLKGMLKEQIVDPRILDLVGAFLVAGFQEPRKPWQPSPEGTPQGGPLSPMLANIYLHYALDTRFKETASGRGHTELYRYCDDFIIVTNHPGRLKTLRRFLNVWMKEAGLSLKEAKTREVDMSSHMRSRDSHLDFLGYRFHLRRFKDNPRRYWIARQPSEKARRALRERYKERLVPNLSVQAAKRQLEETWRGWCEYFRYGNANRVFYGEVHTCKRAVTSYLRKKFRHQRRPVPWRKLYRTGKMMWSGIKPPRVIPSPIRQSATLWDA